MNTLESQIGHYRLLRHSLNLVDVLSVVKFLDAWVIHLWLVSI